MHRTKTNLYLITAVHSTLSFLSNLNITTRVIINVFVIYISFNFIILNITVFYKIARQIHHFMHNHLKNPAIIKELHTKLCTALSNLFLFFIYYTLPNLNLILCYRLYALSPAGSLFAICCFAKLRPFLKIDLLILQKRINYRFRLKGSFKLSITL